MLGVNGGKPPDPPPTETPPGESSDMDISSPIDNNSIYNNERAVSIVEQVNKKIIAERLQETQQKTGNENIPKQTVDRYCCTDTGPFQVYVENNNQEFQGRLNAIKVGDIVLTSFPELDNEICSLDTVGRNRIRIKLKDYKSANYLLEQKNTEF
ncbi:hypothetical protein JTB14_012253 [Gonioctena quinquepunctata]|nr:hypothetical protein JTB14_012253 [Gonioctena quinquepunctata]